MLIRKILLFIGFSFISAEFEQYFQWKQIQFAAIDSNPDNDILFPEEVNSPSSDTSDYIAYNNVPMGVTHYKDRLFVTVPRRRPGIPSTLNYISVKSRKGTSPSFRGYPNFRVNELHPSLRADPQRIISVYRTRVDECNRLWFVDTGLLEYPNNFTQIQRPSIWIINLENHELIRRFEIPQDTVERGNGLASITVDVDAQSCFDAYGYIPDLATHRIFVYSFQQNRMWSFSHNYFSFDPLEGDFNVAGLRYQWDDGIFSITLGQKKRDGSRTAYFHPMASTSEFTVSTQVLRNSEAASRSNHGDDFRFIGRRGPNTQSAMHDYDKATGIIFYSQVATNGVACWNTAKPLTSENIGIIARNNQTMIYPGDLNVDSDGIIWMFTNTMPRFIYSRLNSNEVNFRIWRQPVADAIRGTVCDVAQGGGMYNRRPIFN